MARLSEITVFITDGTAELARTTIRRLIAEGATVVARREPGQPDDPGLDARVDWVTADLTDPEAWQAVSDGIVERHGALHGLVNAAAMMHTGPLSEASPEDLQAMIDLNVLAPALAIRALAPVMKASGGGSIVNITSTEALRGTPNAAVYAATNWASRGLTRSLALELGTDGIRVNTVCSAIDAAEAPARTAASLADGGAARSVTVGDVAAMVAFLLSDDSATCSGSDFIVDAGETA